MGSESIQSVIFSFLGFILKILFDRVKLLWQQQSGFKKTLEGIKRVYELLNTFKVQDDIDRALIYKSENGGGKPKLGNLLYSSAIYESYSENPIKPFWQRQPIDELYIESLSNIDLGKKVDIIVGDMRACQQKLLYQSLGVLRVEMFKIEVSSTKFIYLEIHYKTIERLSDKSENIKRVTINTLIHLWKQYSLD